MRTTTISQVGIALGILTSMAAVAEGSSTSALPESATLDTVVVTAQKKEENINVVPIAITALRGDDLETRGIAAGPSLVEAIPNAVFGKQNFSNFNFAIRGVGNQLIAGSSDQGVGIHENQAPLTTSRFFESQFYDVDRVEVLRGPQGTVYGRNATGGVLNVVTAKPTNQLDGKFSATIGNSDTKQLNGMVNVPVGDLVALRVAAMDLKRGGDTYNTAAGSHIDGRDINSIRATIGFHPSEAFNASLMWERFGENDSRLLSNKQLCKPDPGPQTVGGVPTTQLIGGYQAQWFLSQGCLPSAVTSPSSLGAVNTNATLGGELANIVGLQSGNANAGSFVDPNLRRTAQTFTPRYEAHSDLVVLDLQWQPFTQLKLTSITSFDRESTFSSEDLDSVVATVPFNPSCCTAHNFAPGVTDANGILTSPQLGASQYSDGYTITQTRSQQWSQELRAQSLDNKLINYSLGGIYIHYNAPTMPHYMVVPSGADAFALATGIPSDPSTQPTGNGHNYYASVDGYSFTSTAGFGELYWTPINSLKVTAGVRYTNDRKSDVEYPAEVAQPGYGFPAYTVVTSTAQFKNATGRFGFDWKVSDDSMLYGVVSRGYKAGGFNPPGEVGVDVPLTYKPEFVDALEVGMKNRLFNNTLSVNANAFLYNYHDYQISRMVSLTPINDNVNAHLHGAELELVWSPVASWRVDGNVGYLDTHINAGDSIDPINRTQGNPALTLVKGLVGGSNCVEPTAAVAGLLSAINAGHAPVLALPQSCLTAGSAGVPVDLTGHQLPDAPHWTTNLGAQHTWPLSDGEWNATLRGDYYWRSKSYARIFNTDADVLPAYSNLNASLNFEARRSGLSVLVYVTNLLNKTVITNSYLSDDASGLFTNVFLNDPRLIGVRLTKRFN